MMSLKHSEKDTKIYLYSKNINKFLPITVRLNLSVLLETQSISKSISKST